MFKYLLLALLVAQALCDDVSFVEYGGKIPSEENIDLWFNYNAGGQRDCEVALKRKSDWTTFAYKKVSCQGGQNQFKAMTLNLMSTVPVGAGYVLEIKLLINGVQQAYKGVDVTVQAGKQGFHIYDGKIYDANKAEFIIRGINNAHGDYDNYNRWWAYNALPYIANTKANTVRILWRKYGTLSSTDLDKILSKAIQSKLIPIIEMHDATGSPDAGKLNEAAQFLADNVWLLIKYRKYIMVNIANEWSPHGTDIVKWKDAYKTAVNIIRNAGFSGTLVVDAPAYAQDINGPKSYGKEVLGSDPAKNIVFSVHMYAEWSAQQKNYDLYTELPAIKGLKVPFIVGEFAHKHPAKISGNCVEAQIDARGIMKKCQELGIGYLGWSWAGNGNDDCGSIAYLDISKAWEKNGDYTEWGNILLYDSNGIYYTSKLATVF